MIEFNALFAVQVTALLLMIFFIGLSRERSEKTEETAGKLWKLFMVIVWICILTK